MKVESNLNRITFLNLLLLLCLFFLLICQMSFISAVIVLFLFFYYFKNIKSSLSGIDAMFLTFFALSIISALFSKDKILALGSSLLFVLYYVFFSVGRVIVFDKNKIVKFISLVLLLLMIFGVVFYLYPDMKVNIGIGNIRLIMIPPAKDFEIGNLGIRSPSITPNPVIFSSIFLYLSMFTLLWGLSLIHRDNPKGYFVVGAIILANMIVLFTSNSRSLLLIFPVTLFLGLLLNRESKLVVSSILFLYIFIIAAGSYLYVFPISNSISNGGPSVPTVFVRIREAILSADYTSLSVRLDSYRSGIELFIKNPLFGVGIMNFHLYVPYYWGPYIHNIYLSLLTETGILGFISFFLIIFLILRKYFNEGKVDWFKVSIISLIISFLLHGLIDNTMYVFPLGSLFWFFSGILINDNVS